MAARHLLSGTGLSYAIRRSVRARSGRIVVRPGDVEVVAPPGMPAHRIHAFVHARRAWVLEKSEAFQRQLDVAATLLPARYEDGATLLYRGRPTPLRVTAGAARRARAWTTETGLEVALPGAAASLVDDTPVRAALEAWFRRDLRARAAALAAHHAPRLGVTVRQIRIKQQRHIWGSCGPTGIINLNWRLTGAPDPVFEYVLVHELCHRVHRNHSSAFWALVRHHLPDCDLHRRWLRDHDTVLSRLLAQEPATHHANHR